MRRLVALGEGSIVRGFGLAGATVMAADRAEEVREAWERLPEDTAVVVLTPAAVDALGERLEERPRLLWVVMPP